MTALGEAARQRKEIYQYLVIIVHLQKAVRCNEKVNTFT